MISAKHSRDPERKFVNMMNEKGHFAQRIAGSGCGRYSCCDVITVIKGDVYLTEIKGVTGNELKITANIREQLETMITAAQKHQPLKAMLAVNWKRRGWQIIVLDDITNLSTISYESNKLWGE